MLASILLVAICLLVICSVWSVTIDLTNESQIEYLGRFDKVSNYGHPRADWSGSSFKVHFDSIEGSNVVITTSFNFLQGNTDFFINAFVDGLDQGNYEISHAVGNQFILNLQLPAGSHEFLFVKRTEVSCAAAEGTMEINAIDITGAVIQSVPATNQIGSKILFLGDSITAAYGVDGKSPCSYTPTTQNIVHSFASFVGSALKTQIHTIAWSGKGVVRNYGDVNQMSVDPFPALYNRTLGSTSDLYWEPSQFVPDVVFIQLGTNDYSTDPVPSDSQFIDGYVKFINQIKDDYPTAVLVAACAPMQRGNQCRNIDIAAALGRAHYFSYNDSVVDGGWGCDGHPSAATQQNMADEVTPFLRQFISWNAYYSSE